jgi:hypothetical protein
MDEPDYYDIQELPSSSTEAEQSPPVRTHAAAESKLADVADVTEVTELVCWRFGCTVQQCAFALLFVVWM